MSAFTIYRGRVWHGRSAPARHQFSYRHAWLALTLLPGQPEPDRLRLAPGVSWQRRHHGPRDGSPLLPWLTARLAASGVRDIARVELHTLPSLFGYVFNPVSFYLVFDAAATLRAVWVEVSNTFGQHHDYCLHHPDHRAIGSRDLLDAGKALQVSPFFRVEGSYRFRFLRAADGRFAVRIEYRRDGAHSGFVATQQGTPVPYSPARLWQLLLATGLLSVGVWARIHWQALRLWRKKIPFFGKDGHAATPAPPGELS